VVERHDGEGEPWITKDIVIILHAIGMFVAWGFLLNIGSVIGRYFKKPPHDLFAPRWFRWHAGFQTAGFILALASGLLIVVHLSWNDFPGEHLEGIHQIMGALLLLSAIAQPIIGFQAHRDFLHLRGPGRFHAPHRYLGRVLMIVAVPTMGFGLMELGEIIMPIDAYVWLAFVALVLSVILIICYGEWSLYSTTKSRPPTEVEYELADVSGMVLDEDEHGTDEVDQDEEDIGRADNFKHQLQQEEQSHNAQLLIVDPKIYRRSSIVFLVYLVITGSLVTFLCSYLLNSYLRMGA